MSTPATNHRTEAVRRALVEATVQGLIDRGPDVTVDEIAERSNIGRRTIFRYFPTKDDLIAEAIRVFFQTLREAVPPRDGRDVGEWLEAVARVVHAQNVRMAPAFLELVRRRSELPGVTKYMDRPGRPRRHQLMEVLANEAWSASGGRGRAPKSVAESFTLHLSVFASEALRFHCRHDVDQMARLTVTTLMALMHEQKVATRKHRVT